MSEAKRVLIVTPWYLPLLGGQERQCALLAAQLQRDGYEVDVLTERKPADAPKREILDGVNVIRLRTTPKRRPWSLPLVGLQMAYFLLLNRCRYRFAVVRTLTLPGLLVGKLKAARLLPYRTLVTAETGGDADDVAALRSYPAWRLLRWLLSHHDALNSICADNESHYRELGFPTAKLTRIYNGVDTSPYEESRFPDFVHTFGFLGRLHREKGLWELLDAFTALHGEHPRTRLVLAGSGEEEQALRSSVAERGVGGVTFAGRIPYEGLTDFFESIDCLVLPSYSEGLPLAVLEAAAHKRVLITTDVSDLQLLFGASLFVCKKRDAKDLRGVMETVLDPAAVRDLTYDEAIRRLSITTVARQIEELLAR